MASLKEMRNRISSVKATQKITKALQMVAAAKLRRSQELAESARPYAQRMAAVIANLAAGVSGPSAPRLLVGTGSDRRELVVVTTADRGLAGGFNSGIARAARDHIAGLIAAGKDVKIITVGKKGRDALKRLYGDRFVASFDLGGVKAPGLAQAQPVADKILDLFNGGQVDVVTLFYSRYRSVISQVPTAKKLIPAEVEAGAPKVDLKGAVYE
jgi:F-type H+-transporting ATPase subunit gamma